VGKSKSVKVLSRSLKIKERKSVNAKLLSFRPQKERKTVSLKSFARQRKSTSVKTKKKRVPSSASLG
jgi:hypothetical protein